MLNSYKRLRTLQQLTVLAIYLFQLVIGHYSNMFRQAIAVIGVLSVAINISLAAIEIGAFNTQIYGKSKASKPEIVEIFLEVTIILLYVVIRSRKRSAIA